MINLGKPHEKKVCREDQNNIREQKLCPVKEIISVMFPSKSVKKEDDADDAHKDQNDEESSDYS